MPIGLADRKTDLGNQKQGTTEPKIFLVGSPNVGKSCLFNALTGSYVTVSNYPGTTVGITKGKMKIGGHHEFEVIDTPGMYSFRPITGEEAVARAILLKQDPACILHVVDAKNIDRMLPLTFQLLETGHPIILVLNLFDELEERGMHLDVAHLEHDLGIPVVSTVAIKNTGIDHLRSRIVEVYEKRYSYRDVDIRYSEAMELRVEKACQWLGNGHASNGHSTEGYSVSKRTLATLLLQKDGEILEGLGVKEGDVDFNELLSGVSHREMARLFSEERLRLSQEMLGDHLEFDETKREGAWKEQLSHLMVHPIWGVPFLCLVMWFGIYKFVGEFGAGTLVDLIETKLFMAHINPYVDVFFKSLFGTNMFFDLFAGEYGVITLGLRYAFALVLPIVATFFVAFSIIEDTGYLPRLAMLVDRIFKGIGLSGRAVIPITLGFGCDTMATITTRTLETNKERIIATFLLSLAIPCSAQLGVLLGLMAGRPTLLMIWAGTIGVVFLFSGWLAKQVFKGEDSTFFMELPPLRLPNAVNVFTKTYTRMIWYFKEVVPIFIAASVIIWFGKLTGIFDLLLGWMTYPVVWSGMPEGVTPAFLYGFFRRDFGAAGLFDMAKNGELAGNGLLIASVVLTLFVPCIAQFAVTWKERGKGMAIGMAAFIFPFAFAVGFVLNTFLNVFKITL